MGFCTLKGVVSPMANIQLKGRLHLNLNWCSLEFPRDWFKSPFPKDGLPKYYCRRSANTSDLIKDIYGSVMYSPAAAKTRMTSLLRQQKSLVLVSHVIHWFELSC